MITVIAVSLALQGPAAPPPRMRRVPGDYPTVQAAVDSARERDTVLVSPGRYYENLRLRGRNIVLASEYLTTGDSTFIARTILDGSRPTNPDSGTVISIYRFEDSTTVVAGFTITGGTGTVWYDNKDKIFFREGGGILIDLAGPTIRNNVITGNAATSVEGRALSAGGGGIRAGFADPVIANNVISNNRGRYGGGIVLFYAAAIVRGNHITGNTGGEDFGGAGLWMWGPLSRRLPYVIEGNVIEGNTALPYDGHGRLGGAPPMAGRGGGLSRRDAPALMRDNVIRGNQPNDVEDLPGRP